MVFKIQRNNQLLKEIEGDRDEQVDLMTTEDHYSGKHPQLILPCEDEEILCGDMCTRPAINWGRGKPKPKKIELTASQQRKK